MAATGKVRARLALAAESVLEGIARPGGRRRADRAPGGASVAEPLERRVMLSSAAGLQIAGQSVGFVGKTLTFNADLGPDLAGGSPSYQWNLLNQYGGNYLPPGGLSNTTSSSLVVPGTLPAGTYAVTLAVSEAGVATQDATFPVEVLSAPQGNMIYGTVPSVEGNDAYVSAMTRQADGKIVVAGYWGTEGYDDGGTQVSGWYVARFNPDLTLDPSFQNHHADPMASSQGTAGYFSSIQSLAVNPANGDIIVVGTGDGNSAEGYHLQVAELLANDTAINGQVYHAGAFDPNFNGGAPFAYVPSQYPESGPDGLWTTGKTVTVLPSGDLLVGGGEAVLDPYEGVTAVGSDFLLLELTPDGQLDPSFNGNGVAEQPGVSGAYGDSNYYGNYPPSQILSLAVDGSGNIYAGGVGSPSSGNQSEEGIVLVKYAPNGSIATGFGAEGTDGTNGTYHVYTDSTLFAGSSAAFLSGMELLPNGNLLVVGQASDAPPDPAQVESPPSMVDAHVVLAEYSPIDGSLDPSYGSGGIVNTSINFNSMTPLYDGVLTAPHSDVVGDAYFPQGLGGFAFQPDGSIVGSLESVQQTPNGPADAGWQIVKFVADDGNAADTGTLQSTFAVTAPTANDTFTPWPYPQTVLVAGDSVLVGGTFMQLNQPGRDGDVPQQQNVTADEQPLVVRELLQAPAATNLAAQQTASGAVSLSWSVSEPGQTGFTVERSTTLSGLSTSPQVLDQVGPTQTDYVDTTASADTQYYYQVVPFYSPSGTPQNGTASAPVGIYTADAAASNSVLQEAIQVPLNGSAVTSATTLQAGHYYVVKASGLIHVNAPYVIPGDPNDRDSNGDVIPVQTAAMTADPAWWYDAADPQNTYGNQLTTLASSAPFAATDMAYGLAVGPSGGTLAVPAWGTPDADHHSYTYVVEGTGTALSFQLQGSAQLQFPGSPGSGDKPMEVEIYEVNGTRVPPPPPAQQTGGVVTLQLSVPTVGSGTVLPLLSQPAAIDALAAASDGSQVPWEVSLVSAGGASTLLAQSSSSIGTLPGTPAVAYTLNPAWELDGVYTLQLTTNYPPPSPGSPPPPPAVSVSYPLVVANPVLRITSPATAPDGVTPVIDSSTPVDVLAANPDGSQSQWALSLVSANGTRTLLASSASSAGSLPDSGASVATLDPSLYLNGTYQLELSSSVADPQDTVVDSRTVTIATAVKQGTLTLPVTDATLNTLTGPVAITRVYDSGRVNLPAPPPPPPPPDSSYRPVAPGFGPGWSFGLLDAQLSTSAQADTLGGASATPVLRAGDLVYLTVPDGGRQVFEFDPIPLEQATAYGGSAGSIEYLANFVALDGSGATLSFGFQDFFPYRNQMARNAEQNVFYNPQDDEFGWPGAELGPERDQSTLYQMTQLIDDTHFTGFSPAAAQLWPGTNMDPGIAWDGYKIGGGTYQLTEADGTSYKIDPATGAIESVADQNGNTTTYTYANALGNPGTVTATDALGRTLFTVYTSASNNVTSVQIAGQNPINYGYTNGNLTSVVNQVSQQTTYSYTDAQFPNFLTGVTNNIGQQVLGAHYDPSSGLLDQLTNPSGVTIPVSYTELANGDATQTVVDAAGNITTDVLNPQFGTLLRKIQTQTDGSGNVQDYIVSLSNYNYAVDDAGVISALRPSGVQVLQSVQNFAPFEVQGSDPSGLRYTQQPAGNAWASQTTYGTVNDPSNPAYQQPLSTSQRITDGGALQTTLYGDYVITNAAEHLAKPQVTTVEVQTPDASQPTGYDNQVQSQKYDQYDGSGKLTYSVTAVGRDFGSSRNPGVGVYNDVGEGDYPATLYLTLGGFSLYGDNAPQTLTWNPSAFAYQWSDGSTIGITLTDTSLQSRGSGSPAGGDAWSLSVSDTGASYGDGVTSDLGNLTFDGTPASLSALVTAFFAANPFTDSATHQPVSGNAGLGLTVPNWIGTGTQYLYNGLNTGNGTTGGVVTQTYNVTATISPTGGITFQQVGTQSQSAYYDSSDYTYDSGSNQWVPNPGAAFGAVKYSFDAAGQETYYGYNPQGQKLLEYTYKQWTGPDGSLVNGWVGKTYVYDAAGRLTDTYQATYTDPAADTTQSIAFQAHTLPVIAGGPAGIQVDTSACPLYQGADPLHVTHNDYNALGQLADSIDQYGGQTTYTYDANGNKIRTVYPNGSETRSVYDQLNREIWSTSQYDPSGPNLPILTHTIYNQLGQVVEVDTFDGGTIQIGSQQVGTGTVGTATISTTLVNGVVTPAGGTLASTTKNFYDAAGNKIETIEPSGLRTGSIYTPDGKVLDSGPLSGNAPDGGHSVTTYEGVSTNEFSTADFRVNSSTGYTQTLNSQYDPSLRLFYTHTVDQNGHHTDVYTDALGRKVRTVNDDGSFTETLYGIGSNPVAFDQEGDAIPTPSTWQGIPSGGSEEVDLAQRKAGDPLVPTYKVYDAKGNLVDVYQPQVVDGDPQDTQTYNQLVNPLTKYGYDVAGNEISQTDANGHTTNFGFDQNGNQDREVLPDGESESSTYNRNSQIVSSTDFDGNTAAYTYFTSGVHAGLLSQVVYAGASGSGKATQTVTYGYDDLNRKQAVTDASGTTTDSYDDFGNLVEEQTPEGTIWYVFDPATSNHTETYTANTQTWYGYDLQGRMTSVTVKELNGQMLGTSLTTQSTYDPAGNELTESDPNGETTTYGYDDLNRLTSLTTVNGGTTLFSQTYVLNHNGTRASSSVSQLQPDGSTVTTSTAWSYDALQRLTQEAYTSAAANENYTDVFTYDLASNRMSSAHVGPGGGADETITYGYNGDDELTTQTSSLSGTTTNSYDSNGSLTTSTTNGVTTTYTYDVRNKMVGYSSGSTVAAYVYDDSGNRVQETVNGTTAFYLTDTQNPTRYAQPVEQKTSPTAAPSVTYFLGNRVYAQAEGSGDATYLLADGHGSTQQLVNAVGAVTAAVHYSGFGNALNFMPANAGTVYLFGGDAVYDPASGLYLHGNGVRATNGFLFIQRDTYAGNCQDPLSLHKYLYAEAEPVQNIDQSGHFIGMLASGMIAAGQYAQEAGEAAIAFGQVGMVASAVTYLYATLGYGLSMMSGETEAAHSYQLLQSIALRGLVASAAVFTGGYALSIVGGALITAGASLAALGANYSRIGVIDIGENGIAARMFNNNAGDLYHAEANEAAGAIPEGATRFALDVQGNVANVTPHVFSGSEPTAEQAQEMADYLFYTDPYVDVVNVYTGVGTLTFTQGG